MFTLCCKGGKEERCAKHTCVRAPPRSHKINVVLNKFLTPTTHIFYHNTAVSMITIRFFAHFVVQLKLVWAYVTSEAVVRPRPDWYMPTKARISVYAMGTLWFGCTQHWYMRPNMSIFSLSLRILTISCCGLLNNNNMGWDFQSLEIIH